MVAGKARVLRDMVGEIFITLQLTEGNCLFFQESLIIPFTNVVSIDFLYIYIVKKNCDLTLLTISRVVLSNG